MTSISAFLLAVGVGGVLYTLVVLRRAREQAAYRPVAEDWIWHAILPLIAYAILVAAGIVAPRNPSAGLALAGAVSLGLVLIGIHNSWDTVAFVAVKRRERG